MEAHESHQALVKAFREALTYTTVREMADRLGVTPNHLSKKLSEPKRLLNFHESQLVKASRELQVDEAVCERLVVTLHDAKAAARRTTSRKPQITSQNWREWLKVSATLLEAGRDDQALTLGMEVFEAGRKANNAEWVLEAGREIAALLRLRGEYPKAARVSQQVLKLLQQDGMRSPYYQLAIHNMALTIKAQNPYDTERVEDLLVHILKENQSDPINRLAVRDRLSTLWARWLYSRHLSEKEIRGLVERFEPEEGASLESFYDHEVLARSFTILHDERAEKHLEIASRIGKHVAGAFQHKVQRVKLNLAFVRNDKEAMESLWLSQRRDRIKPFGVYDHYSRDMAALCARAGLAN